MKSLFPIAVLTFILIATPVIASKDDSSKGESENKGRILEQKRIVVSPSTSPNASCDPDGEWDNHGKFVSCVAKLKQGGQVVSQAAQTDIGKQEKEEREEKGKDDDDDASPSPSASASPTTSPSVSPTASASGSANLSGTAEFQIRSVISILEGLIQSFKNLL